MTTTTTPRVGEVAHIPATHSEAGRVPTAFVGVDLKVEKVPTRANEKNAVVKVEGQPRGLRVPVEWLTAGPAPKIEGGEFGRLLAQVEEVDFPMAEGTVVRLTGKPGLFVVTRFSDRSRRGTTHTLAPLGGGRGYTGVTRKHVTIVPIEKITVAD